MKQDMERPIGTVVGRFNLWSVGQQEGVWIDVDIPPEAWDQLDMQGICDRYVYPAALSLIVRLVEKAK
jgi:hypothetical protein